MSTAKLRLATGRKADSPKQIVIQVTINRDNRPCFKTGVIVSPGWIRPEVEIKNGVTKESKTFVQIVVPKLGKLNAIDRTQAQRAKNEVDAYQARLLKICEETGKAHAELLTKEWIADAFSLTLNTPIEELTYSCIVELQTQREQQAQREQGAQQQQCDIYTLFAQMIKARQEQGRMSHERTKAFGVLMRTLCRYEGFKQQFEDKSFKIDIHTITKETIEDFTDYFRNEKSLAEEYPTQFATLLERLPDNINITRKTTAIESRSENTVKKILKLLKYFFAWCNEQGKTTNRPFEGITIGEEEYGTPYYITLDELKSIAERDLSCAPALAVQRDIFVFHCMVGCRVGDLIKFTSNSIIDDEIQYIANKTKKKAPETITVPLNNRAKAIIEKYKDFDRSKYATRANKQPLLPFISTQKYNEAIKDIFSLCGITRNVTRRNPHTGEQEQIAINKVASSHMARRTFVGGLYSSEVDELTICSMSGHKVGSKAFERYRHAESERKKKATSIFE